MSEWNDIEMEDIEINAEAKEVEIYMSSNDQGSIYAVLTFTQIEDIQNMIDIEETQGLKE